MESGVTLTSLSSRCLAILYFFVVGQQYSLALRKPLKARVNVPNTGACHEISRMKKRAGV